MKDDIFEAKMEERHWEIGLEIITEVVKKFIGCYKDPDSSQEHRCIVRNMLANLSLDSTAVKVNELVLEKCHLCFLLFYGASYNGFAK